MENFIFCAVESLHPLQKGVKIDVPHTHQYFRSRYTKFLKVEALSRNIVYSGQNLGCE